MKIGLFHDRMGTVHAAGIATYGRQLATALAETNDVYVYTQEGETVNTLVDSDVSVVTTPNYEFPTLETSLSALELPIGPQMVSKLGMVGWSLREGLISHIEEHVDVLLTFQWLDDLLLSNLVDVPTVYGFLSDEDGGPGIALHRIATRTETRFASSPYLARHVTDSLGYEVDAVIRPGLDVDQFSPDVEPAFSMARPTILFAGRLVAAKGVFDLLEAVAGLEQAVDLRFVGAGPAARKIRRRARALDLDGTVTLEGEIPHGDLPGYYTATDVFCLPTHADSFAMVNLEAMGCGTPVVTTDLAAITDYLTPGEHGVVVPPGDSGALQQALATLLADPDRRRAMGERARRRAAEFSWDEQADHLERLCATAIDAQVVPAR